MQAPQAPDHQLDEAVSPTGDGGYDDGYLAVPCLWGTEPGSLVHGFAQEHSVANQRVLDAGAGEGKNAVYLARRGADVTALELSDAAISNAHRTWPREPNVEWIPADIRSFPLLDSHFDLVVAYGLLHCLATQTEVLSVVERLMEATAPGGHHIVCVFNSRGHDLAAHPGFNPCLLPHDAYIGMYSAWEILDSSDSDLHEVHPHNGIPHCHSMTRLIARKPDALR